jgi:hypothetical protein
MLLSIIIKRCKQLKLANMGSKIAKSRKIATTSNIKLSDAEIELLLLNTKMSREEIIDFHRNFLQDVPNGYVTKRDFVRLFRMLSSNEQNNQKVDKFCEYVFK